MTTDILTSNFFQLFDIPVSYDVDLDLVQDRYRNLQKAVHPDKYTNASDQEKRISMQHTSRVNEAFNTLKQPVARASYLLKLKGVDINLDNETTMDTEFLMEQMEMREALRTVRDNSDPLNQLDKFSDAIKNKSNNMSDDFSKAYKAGKLDDAKELIRKMQFMQKAKHEIEELSATIEDELFQ